jgi:LPXTG-motif cell wall-anchored protein
VRNLEILVVGASDANALPRTGTSSTTLVLVGLALCAVGAMSIRATKRWGGTTD